MSDRNPVGGEEQEPILSLRLPIPTIPPEMRHGVFANQLQQLATMVDTYLDFSLAVPASYERDDAGRITSVNVTNDLVVRVIMPRASFEDFLRNFVRNNPEFFTEAVSETATEGKAE